MLGSPQPRIWNCLVGASTLACCMLAGCVYPTLRRYPAPPAMASLASSLDSSATPTGIPLARELGMVALPQYRIEPPDVLNVAAIRVVPKPPFKIQPQDILQIVAAGTIVSGEIQGFYPVEADGTVNLGASYGAVRVADLTLDEAREAVRRQLLNAGLREENVQVVLTLAQSLASQQISGEHLVAQDGKITLGIYGKVYVAGMTLPEARKAIEEHLSSYLLDPVISVSVSSFSSKFYYVVLEGGIRQAGVNDQIFRVPITGNETVLDAVAVTQGITQFQSKNIWIARPAPDGVGCEQILPVRWKDISSGASTATNYQILPGDRVFIAEDKMWAAQDIVDKMLRPFERMVAFSLLGTQLIQVTNRMPKGVNAGALLAF